MQNTLLLYIFSAAIWLSAGLHATAPAGPSGAASSVGGDPPLRSPRQVVIDTFHAVDQGGGGQLTEPTRIRILEAVQQQLSGADGATTYVDLPVVRQREINESIAGWVRSFPSGVPDKKLTEHEITTKLASLRLGLFNLCTLPVLRVSEESKVDEQINKVVETIVTFVADLINENGQRDNALAQVRQQLLSKFERDKANSLRPVFKAPLPQAELKDLKAGLVKALSERIDVSKLPKLGGKTERGSSVANSTSEPRQWVDELDHQLVFITSFVESRWTKWALENTFADIDFDPPDTQREEEVSRGIYEAAEMERVRSEKWISHKKEEYDQRVAEVRKKLTRENFATDSPFPGGTSTVMKFVWLNVLIAIVLFAVWGFRKWKT